ncbi:MAG: HlyD family type I secretion periplasmic adaptor subunit, partial [Beijerinckiaceae bacterium]|nr:HlyD family type I secretion periplasmic adaptor subunit [Beijerinckiaceae bacterium]
PRTPSELVPAPPSRRAPPPRTRISVFGIRNDAEFHPARLQLDEHPRSPIHGLVLLTLGVLFLCALAWAMFGHISTYTSAPGKVQMLGRTKVVEGLSKGKVQKILVANGDAVTQGQPLVELDPTSALAARTIVADKLTDARAEVQRAQVEIAAARVDNVDPATKIKWAPEVPADVRAREDAVARADLANLAAQIETLRAQKASREAERDKFVKNIAAQKALVAVTQENLTMIETLMKSGFNSQAKYLDMKATLDSQQVMQTSYEGSLENAKQAILVLDSQIAHAREVFVAKHTQEISNDEQVIVDLAQQLVRANVTLANMTLRAPVAGVVHASAVTTIGQVVRPGQQLLQIVPSGQPLEIEAYVQNGEVGFIRKGDKATVKVDAFTYNIFGAIDATVTDVANDSSKLQGVKSTVQDASLDGAYGSTSAADKTGNLQYPVHLRADQTWMMVEGKKVPLVPGMLVNVEIELEKLRAIDYVLSPIEALFSTAAHER